MVRTQTAFGRGDPFLRGGKIERRRAIRRFRKDYPDIDFSIKYTGTGFILKQLLEGTTELGFCGDYDINAKQYETLERLLRNELIPPENEDEKKRTLTDLLRRKKEGNDHVE